RWFLLDFQDESNYCVFSGSHFIVIRNSQMLWKSQSGASWRGGVLSVSSRAMSARLKGYLTLIRPPNTVMIGLAVIIGEAIAIAPKLPGVQAAIFGFLTASLMMAGTMVANDVYDVEIDRVNSPQRPLPSGTIKVKEAIVLAVALSAAAIGLAALRGSWPFLTT